MKIGLFGGSFNPIHNNHLKMIDGTLNKNFVDEVWIVPCKNHAFSKNLIPPSKRVRMIELAIGDRKNVKIDKIELESKGKNHTIETLRKLKKTYPYEFYLIIGSDVLSEFRKWYKNEELVKEAKFLVFQRKGYRIPRNFKGKIKIIKKFSLEMSSTEIRKRAKEGKSISRLVPVEIKNYIIREGIYNGI